MRCLTALVTTLALCASTALAAPKSGPARAQFDRGVAAYTKGDYAAASEALAASYALEENEETLFAWAQTERKLGRCDKAIELYGKLLAMPLPAENKQAIEVQISECNDLITAEKAATAMVEPPAPSEPSATPPPASPSDTRPDTDAAVSVDARVWWKDPVGGALVGAGVVVLALGTVFLVQGNSADGDKESAATYDEYRALDDRAKSRGALGVLSLVAGGALVAGGVVWYVTRKPSSERAVSGWVAPSGGGLALTGRF